MIPFVGNVKNRQMGRNRKVGSWFAGTARRGEMTVMAKGYGVPFGSDAVFYS